MRSHFRAKTADVVKAALALPVPVAFALVVLAPAAQAESTSSKTKLNADGSTSMTYSTEVEDLGTRFGIDMSAPAESAVPQTVAGTETVSGSAYAKVSLARLPDWLLWQKGAVNVAVSPTDEESKVGTTLSRSWTVNDGVKATLSDSYQVDRSSSGNGWETDKSFSVKLTESGTTFAIGAKASDETPQFLPRVSAQQKIFGDINVTTSVADNGSSYDKSITAGFSHRW